MFNFNVLSVRRHIRILPDIPNCNCNYAYTYTVNTPLLGSQLQSCVL